jgi:tRNA (guanosine-2'-O-)-methyltransferase
MPRQASAQVVLQEHTPLAEPQVSLPDGKAAAKFTVSHYPSEGAVRKNMHAISAERAAKIRNVLARRQKGLTLALANIHDPHNVSAIYRSCDAFGVPQVHLYYTDTPFPALGERSSASARKWVSSVRHTAPEEFMAALKAQGMRVYAASCSVASRPVGELNFTLPTAFILGNEHRGVDAELLPHVDGEVHIPMYGMIQSFNVSVAAAILLAEASRQRRAAGMYERPSYSEEELAALYDEWAAK